MATVDVFGVKIDDIPMDQAVERVMGWLSVISGMTKHYSIVTPNPEFIVLAQKDAEFKKILNQADLSIPDGAGLKLAGIKNRVAGVDLMEKLCQESAKSAFTIGLLGGRDGVAVKAGKVLTKKYLGLKVVYAESGGEISTPLTTNYLPDRQAGQLPATDILFVAFGQGKQERWIAGNLQQAQAKVLMGVGGAFDYISGLVPRAPIWMRKVGLEWLYRLWVQPWRLKRQLSLLQFLRMVLTSR